MTQTDLTGQCPQAFIDVHEVKGRGSESSITLFRDFLKENNVFYQVRKLEVGDIVFGGDYAIERKTVGDFCHSLFGSKHGNPRLMNQMKALKEAYENPILLLEGGLAIQRNPSLGAIFYLKHLKKHENNEHLYWALLRRVNMHPNQLDGALQTVTDMRVRVIKSFNEEDGARVLREVFSEAKEEEEEKEEKRTRPPTLRQKPTLKTLLDKQIFFLSGFPQISTVRAKKLLEAFDDPFNAIENIEKWTDIKGIGEKTVKKVKKVLFRCELKQEESST